MPKNLYRGEKILERKLHVISMKNHNRGEDKAERAFRRYGSGGA